MSLVKHIVLAAAVLAVMTAVQAIPGAAFAQSRSLTITYVKYPLNAPLIVAKVLGLFESEFTPDGWNVDWADIVTGPGQAEALAAGAVQFASVISSDAVLTARSQGKPIRAIGVFARAPRTFSLVAKSPSVKTVRDLRGKTVAGPKGTLMHLMLMAALEREGMAENEITFVNMPVSTALTAVLSGGVDAALTAGPGKIRALADGAHEVVNGEGLTKGVILTAVNEDFLKAHPGLVRRYLQVHQRAVAFLAAEPDKARRMIAMETGLTTEEVERLLPEYDFTPGITGSDKSDLATVQAFLVRTGIITAPTDLSALFWP